MSSSGRKLLSALVYKQDVKAFLDMQLKEELFIGSEVELFQAIHAHVASYGKIPALVTLQEYDKFENALVDIHEPPLYYLKEVEQRYKHKQIKVAVLAAQEALKDENPDLAFQAISDVVLTLSRVNNRKHLFDFKDAYTLVLEEYFAQQNDLEEYTIKFGWETIDEMTGGIRAGDMVSFVGRPAAGKTYMLLNCALHNWRDCDQPILFVTMEMTAMSIMQRLAAMYTHKPVKNILKSALSTKALTSFELEIQGVKNHAHPFYLVDGNLSTRVDDVIMLCHQLKPRAVFIDGAYLLRNKNTRLSKWERITENAEEIKRDIATELGIPPICSYQLGREVLKKKKSDKAGVEDIYGTDAIGQLSTIVLGLFETENVGTLIRRKIDIIKGRNGEVGEFITHWNFNSMNFQEWIEPKTEDLQYIDGDM